MFYTNIDAILQNYSICEDESKGILVAEKQIFIPQHEMILPMGCQEATQEMVIIKGGI